MEQYKKWLEEQIEVTLEDKDLQREHWAYCTAYKKLIEALPIHVVVRGGVIEAQSVQLTENDLKWVNSCVTQITPTEPLPAEGVAQNGRGGKVVKFEDPIRKKILKQIIDTTKSF